MSKFFKLQFVWIRHKGSNSCDGVKLYFSGAYSKLAKLINTNRNQPRSSRTGRQHARLPPYFHCDGRGRHCSVLGNVGSLHRSSSCSRHVLQREGGREGGAQTGLEHRHKQFILWDVWSWNPVWLTHNTRHTTQPTRGHGECRMKVVKS